MTNDPQNNQQTQQHTQNTAWIINHTLLHLAQILQLEVREDLIERRRDRLALLEVHSQVGKTLPSRSASPRPGPKHMMPSSMLGT